MNPLESQLDYPFGDSLPAPGTVLEVAPGLRWLRMPLPFALDHINLWLLDDERERHARLDRGRLRHRHRRHPRRLGTDLRQRPGAACRCCGCSPPIATRTTSACPTGCAERLERAAVDDAPASSASRA